MRVFRSPFGLVRSFEAAAQNFTWGATPVKAVYNSVMLETFARMAAVTIGLNPKVPRLKPYLIDKHHRRKHGREYCSS
jgi:L-ribulose-5-phosphate 4-epimerase